MPVYEYRCEKCGKQFEVIQRISDPDLRNHSELTEHQCGGTLVKVLFPPALHFKGDGWTEKVYK